MGGVGDTIQFITGDKWIFAILRINRDLAFKAWSGIC